MKYLFIILYLITAISVNAEDFVIDSNSEGNLVRFESTAKLEFIKGESSNITGLIKFNPTYPDDTVFCVIKVDLRQLNTGIETRDEHMRDNHLHTDDYPFAYFELLSISGLPEAIKSGYDYKLKAEGYFYIHGVKRKINPEINFIWNKENNQISVSTNFKIELDKYKIPRPKALFLKLAEVIEINVKFIGYSNLTQPALILPNYPELN